MQLGDNKQVQIQFSTLTKILCQFSLLALGMCEKMMLIHTLGTSCQSTLQLVFFSCVNPSC
jgi:hypothetical protein